MAHNILVWIETFKGKALPISYECLGQAQRLASAGGGTVTAAVFGEGAAAIAAEAITFGAGKVITCDDATLSEFRPDPYVALLAKVAKDLEPDVIMAGASTRGRDVTSGLAVELETGTIADCTAIDQQDGQIMVTRPVYAGKLLSTVVVPDKRPLIITIRSRAFPLPEATAGRTGEVTAVAAVLSEDQITSKVTGFAAEGEGEVSLNDARIIVSGGRGVGGPEGFKPVADLAKTLGGALGASRAAVDAGWIPYSHQVGQTGKTVAPDLYIACGISGAIQHQAGMRTAKVVVAINKDADAPIFKLARYGVVGDLFQIVPALDTEFKKRLGR